MNDQHSGNGAYVKPKAFDLVPPKTPEQIAREETLAAMPKLRRECSRDPRLKRCVGAKWLFGQISDNTFLHTYGGDGYGRIYISIKDLKRIYGHDEGTIALWRDKLIETGWIWYRDMWPKSCWGITGVCRQPELFPPNSEFITQYVKGDADEEIANGNLTSGMHFSTENAKSSQTVGESPDSNGKVPGSPLVSLPQSAGESPAVSGNLTAQTNGESPAVNGRASHSKTGNSHRFAGKSRVGSLVSGQHIKESLGSNGGLEGKQGESPAPAVDDEAAFKNWERRLDDYRNSDLRKLNEEVSREYQNARSDEAKATAKRKLAAIRLRTHGPSVNEPKAPMRGMKPGPDKPVMPVEDRKKLFAKAKAEVGL